MKSCSVFLVIICLVFTGTAYGARNMLPNAGFEEPEGIVGSNPSQWWSWNPEYNGLTIEKMRTGNQSVYISSPPEAETHSGILYYSRNITPGKTYEFSCYVLNSDKDPVTGGAFGQLSIEWKRGETEIARSWGPTFGPDLSTSEWKLQSVTAVAPDDANGCNFVIQFFNKDGKGTFYADDVMVEEK